MTLTDLIELVDRHYPDHCILAHWDAANGRPEARKVTDTLALFIVRELHRTFRPGASDVDQLKAALSSMRIADKDVQKVTAALETALHEAEEKERKKVIPFPSPNTESDA